MMKVNIIIFLLLLRATSIDAWSSNVPSARGAIGGSHQQIGRYDTTRRISSAPQSRHTISKARGSPLWATGYDDDDNSSTSYRYSNIRSSQRRVRELMDRSNLIREQVEESSLRPSFVWLSDQLVSLTTHLRERYQEMREMAYRQGNDLSEQERKTLYWLEGELEAVHAQLDSYGRIVAATLHETPDDYALQRELTELAELSQQIQLALGQVPDSDREEMEEAYVKTQSSLGRLNDLRQELADIESALNEMEGNSMYVQDEWQDEAAWETDELDTTTVVTGTPLPGYRTRTSSTQLKSQLNSLDFNEENNRGGTFQQLAGEWQTSDQDQPYKPKFQPPKPQMPASEEPLPPGLSLYDIRTQKVASAAAAGKSRWGDMENSLAAVLAAQISDQPVEDIVPDTFPEPHVETSLYDRRTQNVAAAAAAGKSRWGQMENSRATMLSEGSTTTSYREEFRVKPDRPTQLGMGIQDLYNQRVQNVAASAQAGKSRWGFMENDRASVLADSTSPKFESPMEYISYGPKGSGGTSFSDTPTPPISNGFVTEEDSKSPGIAPGFGQRTQELAAQTGGGAGQEKSLTTPSGASLYNQRRQKVAASSFAGQSRWGAMETERAKTGASIVGQNASPPVPSTSQQEPKVGSVPHTSKASNTRFEASAQAIPTDATLYDQRNAQVAEAAAAGMSRWGTMETERATNAFGLKQALDTLENRAPPPPQPVLETRSPPSPPPVIPTPPAASSQPKGSSSTVDPMEQLAREWAAMNRGPDSQSTKPSPPQPKSRVPTPVQPKVLDPVQPRGASAPEQVAPTAQPKGSSAAEDPMERLAREWAAMNRDPDGRSYQAPPPPPQTKPQNPPPVQPQVASTPTTNVPPPPPASSSSVTMDQLAQEWAALNSDSTANGASFAPPEAVPPPPPVQGTPSPSVASSMDDLAREWAARNMDYQGSAYTAAPVPQSPPSVPEPHETFQSEPPVPPHRIPNDWERLAQEWMNINSDKA